MTRKITIMALIAGVVLGAATTEGFNIYRQSHNSRIFQERMHCKAVADAYVKENSTDFKKDPNPLVAVTVQLDKVDYSPARNSCVAELETTNWESRTVLESSSVQDLLSGESLFSANCAGGCLAVKPVYTDAAFDYVLKNASEPLELEKAYLYYMKSETPTKSAPPPDAPASQHKSAPPSSR